MIVSSRPARGGASRAASGLVLFAEAPLADGFVSPGAEARGDPVPPARPPPPRGRSGARRAAASRPSPTCGSATTSSTRTTASPASPASRRRPSAGSPATTSSSSTAATTGSSRPPSSSPRSPATSARAASAPQLSALGSKRWEGVKARARRAARELAGELLNLYAERRARRGHAFPPDGEWQLDARARRSPTARPPTSSRRSRRSRPTWSPSGRWTG